MHASRAAITFAPSVLQHRPLALAFLCVCVGTLAWLYAPVLGWNGCVWQGVLAMSPSWCSSHCYRAGAWLLRSVGPFCSSLHCDIFPWLRAGATAHDSLPLPQFGHDAPAVVSSGRLRSARPRVVLIVLCGPGLRQAALLVWSGPDLHCRACLGCRGGLSEGAPRRCCARREGVVTKTCVVSMPGSTNIGGSFLMTRVAGASVVALFAVPSSLVEGVRCHARVSLSLCVTERHLVCGMRQLHGGVAYRLLLGGGGGRGCEGRHRVAHMSAGSDRWRALS